MLTCSPRSLSRKIFPARRILEFFVEVCHISSLRRCLIPSFLPSSTNLLFIGLHCLWPFSKRPIHPLLFYNLRNVFRHLARFLSFNILPVILLSFVSEQSGIHLFRIHYSVSWNLFRFSNIFYSRQEALEIIESVVLTILSIRLRQEPLIKQILAGISIFDGHLHVRFRYLPSFWRLLKAVLNDVFELSSEVLSRALWSVITGILHRSYSKSTLSSGYDFKLGGSSCMIFIMT